MMRGIYRWTRYLVIATLFCFYYKQGYAQTDVVTLSKIKDFINASLTRIILSSDSLKKDSSARYLPGIDSVLQKNTPENPVYYAAMQKLLEGKFDSVTKRFSSKVDQINVRAYQQYNYEQAGKLIYDSVFKLMRQQYSFVLPPTAKDSLFTLLTRPQGISEDSITAVRDTLTKALPQQVSKPSEYVPWYARFQGFVFWLLACVLISVALFLYCLDQIRQLKAKLTDTEKQVVYLEEKEHGISHQGQVTTVYTEFRNLVTLKIKELYDIIDHLNQRIIHLETTHLPAPENDVITHESNKMGQTFYMSVPLEGYFPFSARALKKDSLYRFVVNGADNEAHFEVINDGMPLTEALRDVSKFIEPACNLENDLTGEVRVIITKTQGKVRLDEEKWVIEEKASIIFI